MKEDKIFRYTYSADREEEIKNIRLKYLATKEGKMARLRNLDRRITGRGFIVALLISILSGFALGVGVCLTMTTTGALFFPGLVNCAAGIFGTLMAVPIHRQITNNQRKKHAPEILRITEELMRG